MGPGKSWLVSHLINRSSVHLYMREVAPVFHGRPAPSGTGVYLLLTFIRPHDSWRIGEHTLVQSLCSRINDVEKVI